MKCILFLSLARGCTHCGLGFGRRHSGLASCCSVYSLGFDRGLRFDLGPAFSIGCCLCLGLYLFLYLCLCTDLRFGCGLCCFLRCGRCTPSATSAAPTSATTTTRTTRRSVRCGGRRCRSKEYPVQVIAAVDASRLADHAVGTIGDTGIFDIHASDVLCGGCLQIPLFSGYRGTDRKSGSRTAVEGDAARNRYAVTGGERKRIAGSGVLGKV